MSTKPDSLPEYRKPPVAEVAVSIQFDPIESLNAAVLGLLWGEYQAEYPLSEQHPPLPRVVEVFGEQKSPQLKVERKFPTPRLWFLAEEKTKLIQVQQDRFILNWRKYDTDAEYPRYRTLRAEFEAHFGTFERFVDRECDRSILPNQSELTYVNHIVSSDNWHGPEDLSGVVNLWSSTEGILGKLDNANLRASFLMKDADTYHGRLHIGVSMGTMAEDEQPVLVLQLIARGAPVEQNLRGALGFLDAAHRWIVEGFTAVTTDKMHKEWERKR